MTGHTPGPWYVDGDGASVYWEAPSGRRWLLAQAIEPPVRPSEEVKANARLIAAAPDLLEMVLALNGVLNDVLERLAELPETYQYGLHGTSAMQQKALEAIAKAEGDRSHYHPCGHCKQQETGFACFDTDESVTKHAGIYQLCDRCEDALIVIDPEPAS